MNAMLRRTAVFLMALLVSTPALARGYFGPGTRFVDDRLANPAALNPWAYANGSPMRLTDPDGRDAVDIFGPFAPFFRGGSAVQRRMNAASAAQNADGLMLTEAAMSSVATVRRSAPYRAGAGVVRAGRDIGDAVGDYIAWRQSMSFSEYNEWAQSHDEPLVGGTVRGAVDSAQRAGKNWGEGGGACATGDAYECTHKLSLAVVETVMLVEGGRGLAAGSVRSGAIRGDLALPANRHTLNPLNWEATFWEAAAGEPPLLHTGLNLKGLRYRGPEAHRIDLARVRDELGLRPATGNAKEQGGVLTKLVFDSQDEVFGINTWAGGDAQAAAAYRRAGFVVSDTTTGAPAAAMTMGHAEGDSFLQGFIKGLGRGGEADLFIDASRCGTCANNVGPLGRRLGLKRLRVHELQPDGSWGVKQYDY